MNWESWELPKNSLNAAVMGRLLIRFVGVASSGPIVLILSFIVCSNLKRPMRNWFWMRWPAVLTRLFPRWSISSGSSSPLFIKMIRLTISIKSSLVKARWEEGVSSCSLLFNLYLPILPRSYLLGLKKRLWNRFCAFSYVGSSPGLNLLYISFKASSLLLPEASLSIVDLI